MVHRFFVDQPIHTNAIDLEGAEAHHLIHALRASIGTEVVLWDGSGAEFSARIINLTRSSARLEILARKEVDRELPIKITLGVALPKGDRQRWLVEKAVELGVATIVPLITERSVVRPTDQVLSRMRRTAIEASKQCGRNRLAEVAPAHNVAEYFLTAPKKSAVRLVAHPDSPNTSPMARDDPSTQSAVARYLAVGPEGGFTNREIRMATEADWQILGLGPRTLRTETAAIALVAAGTIRLPHST